MKKRITLDERQVAQVEALAGLLTQEQLADYFGVHRHTMDHIMERQPEGAIIFYLKTQGRWSTVQDEQPQELLAMRIERVIVRAEERLTSEQNHATN
jgi:transposase